MFLRLLHRYDIHVNRPGCFAMPIMHGRCGADFQPASGWRRRPSERVWGKFLQPFAFVRFFTVDIDVRRGVIPAVPSGLLSYRLPVPGIEMPGYFQLSLTG